MFTHINVLSILLKNISIVWQSGSRDLNVQIRCILPATVSQLEDPKTNCDKLQAPQWVNMDCKLHVSVSYGTYKPCKWMGRSCNTSTGIYIYLLFYFTFHSQGHIATGSLQVEETSAYCTENNRASASNYQLSNMKRQAWDLKRWPQRLEVRTLTTSPPSPLTTKENACAQVSHKLSWDIDVFIGIDRTENVHTNFIAGSVYSAIKSHL